MTYLVVRTEVQSIATSGPVGGGQRSEDRSALSERWLERYGTDELHKAERIFQLLAASPEVRAGLHRIKVIQAMPMIITHSDKAPSRGAALEAPAGG